MFVRIRWFLLGVVAAAVAGGYLAARVTAMRERLDRRTLARAALLSLADLLEVAGNRLARGEEATEG